MRAALCRILAGVLVVGQSVSTTPAFAQISPAQMKAQKDRAAREALAQEQIERRRAGSPARVSPVERAGKSGTNQQNPRSARRAPKPPSPTNSQAALDLDARRILTFGSAIDACEAAKKSSETGATFNLKLSDVTTLEAGAYIWNSPKGQFETISQYKLRKEQEQLKWQAENGFFAVGRTLGRYSNSYNPETQIYSFEGRNESINVSYASAVMSYVSATTLSGMIELQKYQLFSAKIDPIKAENIFRNSEDHEIIRIFKLSPPFFETNQNYTRAIASNVCRFLRRRIDNKVLFFDSSEFFFEQVTPITHPSLWFTRSDFPRKALKEKRGGRVEFTLNINSDGTVSDCAILKSSGWADLDFQTCDVAKRRAKFLIPSHHIYTKIPNTYSNSVSWDS